MALIICKHFGFAEDFCLEAIESLLENEFISEEPLVFSNSIIADYFVHESYRIISQIHPLKGNEISWLLKVSEANNIKLPLLGSTEKS